MDLKKLRITKIRIVRIFTQILFFILLPGLYVSTFSGIKLIYTGILGGKFDFVSMLPYLIACLVIVPVTIIAGRFFCGWMCSFGALGDMIYEISKPVLKKRFKMPEQVDRALKYLKYVVLALLILFGWSLGYTTFQNANPWDVFGMLFTVGAVPDITYVITNLAPAVIILLVIITASFFVERFFCRYLCPLGAIFEVTSKLRITAIAKPSKDCGNCRLCTKNCPMAIPLYKEDKVKSGACINCFECFSNCPRKNVSMTVVEQDVRPILLSTMAVTAITGAYYAGSFATNSTAYASTVIGAVTDTASASDQLYKDGTFEGSGTGYRGRTTTVSVTIEEGMITDVSLVSTGDDAKFFNHAFRSVISAIIQEQDYNVDTVSGATYSSNGIMEAVANALSESSNENDIVKNNTASSTTITESADVAENTVNDATDESTTDIVTVSTTDNTTGNVTDSTANSTTDSAKDSTAGNVADTTTADTTENFVFNNNQDSKNNSPDQSQNNSSDSSFKKPTMSGDGRRGHGRGSTPDQSTSQTQPDTTSQNSNTDSQSSVPNATDSASESKADVIIQNNTTSGTKNANQASVSTVSQTPSQTYKDGTYEGSGTGFRGGTTTVAITVENGTIVGISVISTEDDAPFFNRAYSSVTDAIISEQATDVDAVSGATYSSNGIMEAVANALLSAQTQS